MAQLLLPDGDVSVFNFSIGCFGSTTNIYTAIDDNVSSPGSDFITDNDFSASSVYECSMENPASTPGAGSSFLKVNASVTFGGPETVTVAVYSNSSLVQSFTQSVTTTQATFTKEITNSIPNYNTLEVRLGPGGSTNCQVQYFAVNLEVPDAAGGGGGEGPKLNPEAFLMFL